MRLEIKAHVYGIPRRLREIDRSLRCFFNTATQKYEVWGMDAHFKPYRLGVWDELDQRVLTAVRKGYWLARNTGDPYRYYLRELDEHEENLERQWQKEVSEITYGMQDDFKYFGREVYPGWGR